MRYFRNFFFLLLFSVSYSGQAQPEQDCINAIPICQNSYSQNNSYSGIGNGGNEINNSTSCLGAGELNSVWYTLTVQSAGNLSFVITPNTPSDDYDWAVYNLSNAACADIFSNPALEVSCNYSAFPGSTGPDGGSGFSSQGAGGTPYNAVIPVTAGETYAVLINNNSNSAAGYTIDFGASTAQVFDNIPPVMNSVQIPVACGATQLQVTFSENILCNTVQPTDFTVSGPGGSYPVTSAASALCSSGSPYDNAFTISVGSPLNMSGSYYVILQGSVTDLCGNAALPDSIPFIIISPITVSLSSDSACEGNPTTITATAGGNTGPYTYLYSGPGGLAAASNPAIYTYPSAGTYAYTLLVTDGNGCSVITADSVLVNSLPAAGFTYSANGNEVSFVNTSSGAVSYTWNFGGNDTSSVKDPTHYFFDSTLYIVQLIAESADGCRDTLSDTIIIVPFTVFIPDAFSPNGDGKNEVFYVYGQGIYHFRMRIFNRWGEELLYTEDVDKGWDGKSKGGSPLGEDVYTYYVTMENYEGVKCEKKGTVTLLR